MPDQGAVATEQLVAFTKQVCAREISLQGSLVVFLMVTNDVVIVASLLWQRRGVDTSACALLPHRDRPAERTPQPLGLHHPELLVVLPDDHAALIEVEQHADAIALLLRGLHPLSVVGGGQAAPGGVRAVEAVAVPIVRALPSLHVSARPDHAEEHVDVRCHRKMHEVTTRLHHHLARRGNGV